MAEKHYRLNKEDALVLFTKRFADMDTARSKFTRDWDICDLQYAADVSEDPNTGEININVSIEADTVEVDLGRTSGRPIFDIVPDPYDPNPEEVEIAKYTLIGFLDREPFLKEYRKYRMDKSVYGTGILYAGMRYEITRSVSFKKDTVSAETLGSGLLADKKNQQEEVKESWFITPCNVPIRNFWIDDSALGQSDFSKAVDCIYAEVLSKEAFDNKYNNEQIKSSYNKISAENTMPTQEADIEYNNQEATSNDVVVYHYYNKIAGRYIVVANKVNVLYDGGLIYDGLPFSLTQHFPVNNCIYGKGYTHKLRTAKAYINNITQDIISGSRLSASKIFGLGQSGALEEGEYLSAIPGAITMARFTNGIDQVRTLDTQVNISQLAEARNIAQEMARTATGVDLNSPFEPPADTLGQTEIIEENKSIRNKCVDEDRDMGLEIALEKTLYNIKNFAPSVLKRKIIVDGGETITRRPVIQIKNVKIEKSGKNIKTIEEDYGNYGYLELTDDMIKGDLKVRVTTPATNNAILQTIEKNKAEQMINNLATLYQIYGQEVVNAEMPVADVIEKYKQAYGYSKKMIPATKKKKIRLENEKALADAQEVLSMLSGQNANTQIPAPQEGQSIEGGDQATQMNDNEAPRQGSIPASNDGGMQITSGGI